MVNLFVELNDVLSELTENLVTRLMGSLLTSASVCWFVGFKDVKVVSEL